MNPYLEEQQIEELNRFDFYESLRDDSLNEDLEYDDASFAELLNSTNDF
jgi:hypothetical protein